MPLPFKTQPQQSAVEIGDDIIGRLNFPIRWGLTVNEQALIDQATAKHKGYQKLALDFADKLLKGWDTDLERSEVGNCLLQLIGILDQEQPRQKEVLAYISEHHQKAFENLIEAIADEIKIRRAAYIQAAMVSRFSEDEWEIEWGWEIEACPVQGWSKPLAQEIYLQMLKEEQGQRHDNEVIDTEFKGFTAQSAKKSQPSTQKALTGAASSG